MLHPIGTPILELPPGLATPHPARFSDKLLLIRRAFFRDHGVALTRFSASAGPLFAKNRRHSVLAACSRLGAVCLVALQARSTSFVGPSAGVFAQRRGDVFLHGHGNRFHASLCFLGNAP